MLETQASKTTAVYLTLTIVMKCCFYENKCEVILNIRSPNILKEVQSPNAKMVLLLKIEPYLAKMAKLLFKLLKRSKAYY